MASSPCSGLCLRPDGRSQHHARQDSRRSKTRCSLRPSLCPHCRSREGKKPSGCRSNRDVILLSPRTCHHVCITTAPRLHWIRCQAFSTPPAATCASASSWEDSEHGVVWDTDKIAALTGGRVLREGPSGPVLTDTRIMTTEGAWFLALEGENYNGHDFLREAAARGCAGAIVSQPPPPGDWDRGLVVVEDTYAALQDLASNVRDRFRGTVVGITGSCGKTTIKGMVAAVAGSHRRVHAASGNMNNAIGLPLTLLGTPSSADLLVLELGMSRPGEIALLTDISRPHVRVISCVAPAHLAGVGGTIEGVVSAKAEILADMGPGDTAILNGDDRHVMSMAVPDSASAVMTFGASLDADVRIESGVEARHQQQPEDFASGLSSAFYLRDCGTEGANDEQQGGTTAASDDVLPSLVEMPCLGRHLPECAGAAMAVARALEIPWNDAIEGLSRYRGVPMRMEVVSGGGRPGNNEDTNAALVINDAYNANPTSLKSALELLAELPVPRGSRRVALLGDMLELGDQEAGAHIGALRLAAALGVDVVGVTGPAMRRAAAALLRTDPSVQLLHGGINTLRILEASTAKELAAEAAPLLGPGDVVLLKGSRAMRMEEGIPILLPQRAAQNTA